MRLRNGTSVKRAKPKVVKKPSRTTILEDRMAEQIEEAGLPEYEREYRFHPQRRWRFDFAFVDAFVGVEVEGGVWSRGRHIQPAGFEEDCVKYGEALALGWKVLRVTGRMISNSLGIDLLKRVLSRETGVNYA